ncbi:MAG: transcription termination factor Rho [Acidimicrobiia bacterium]|nr:transcription termination factor Rho [Acidimicrobiia bacterium]
MSVDSTALERSALERKDRDELLTIAKALGGEPKARVKKADIVDMILDLAGVGSGPDAAVPVVAAPESAAPESAARVPRARSPRSTEVPSRDGATGGPAVSTQTGPAARFESADRPPGSPDRGGRNGAQGRGGSQRRDGNGNGGNSGNGNSGGPSSEAGDNQNEDDESSNRRRRRRGRNRGQGDGQSSGSGQGSGVVEEYTGEPIDVEGYLDLRDEGYGFLRISGYLPSKDDVYVSVKQARQLGLRRGDQLKGASRPALRNEKNPALLRIDLVNGDDPEKARDRRSFDDLTPLFPDSKLTLELPRAAEDMTARIVDLIAPIGKGQRGLIVSPPKAGKTTVVKQIVRSIEMNHPEVHLLVLLVDERPEEVTDMKRWLKNDTSTVVASTFDRPAEEHTQVAELVIERAKRLVEDGRDVVVILDGITRLSRAYNLAAPPSGRVMSGGIDTAALYPPKKFFGAARNVEEGGSLTILATALVETGSRMDEVIFEEFKGTGNMELRLDRRLAEQRIYPAVDIEASSTRHEELLFLGTQLQQVWKLRRVLSTMSGEAGVELLTERMKTFKTNKEFLAEVAKAGAS